MISVKKLRHTHRRVWGVYSDFIRQTVIGKGSWHLTTEDLSDKLFLNALIYGLPIGALVIVLCIFIKSANSLNTPEILGIALFLFVALTSLNSVLNLSAKKTLATTALVVMACIAFVFWGVGGSGFIYLLLFNVFYTLHLKAKFAVQSLLINLVVCAVIALLITFNVQVGVIPITSLRTWGISVINFLFLNAVIIVMIRYTISNLNRSLIAEEITYKQLKNEQAEKSLLNNSLHESEERYKTLFATSPCAQLIINIETLKFIEVNQAASMIYGYSEKEFSQLTLPELYQVEDETELFLMLSSPSPLRATLDMYHVKQIRKDGSCIDVEVSWSDVEYRGKLSRMLTVNNITMEIAQLRAISKQHETLKKIAMIQSHDVRLPLTNIMALTKLISEEHRGETDPQLFNYLHQSAQNLDKLVHNVIRESESILNDLDHEHLINDQGKSRNR